MGDFGIGGNLQRKEQELGGFGIPKALPNPRGAREGPKSIFGPPEKAILGLSKPFPIPALGPLPVPAALPGARKGFSDRPKMHFGIPRTLPSPRGAPGGPNSIFGPKTAWGGSRPPDALDAANQFIWPRIFSASGAARRRQPAPGGLGGGETILRTSKN